MVKETKTNEEYKTPKCRVVETHVQHVLCSSQNGLSDWEEDDDPLNV